MNSLAITCRPLRRATLAAAMAMLLLTGCSNNDSQAQSDPKADSAAAELPKKSAANQANLDRLLVSYTNMAQAAYQDALDSALKLQKAVDTLVADPTEANLEAARAAYKAARKPYAQTEIFRFDEGFVSKNDQRKIANTDEWEAQVNAWPLDEALIDYVSADYQGEYNNKANIINSDSITVGNLKQDTKTITPELLAKMNEIGGSEANVTTGYHTIEFLLWGQDTNGVGEGAGNRPASDYSTSPTGSCTSGDTVNPDAKVCERRGQYLMAATQLLVDDLTAMTREWQPEVDNTLRADILSRKDGNALRQILYQMGSLALGELASERMQVAFVTGSTEDENECFSDLTHLSFANNARGIQNIFDGSYKSLGGKSVGGYGLKQYLIDSNHKAEADKLAADFKKVEDAFNTIVNNAEKNNIKVDQMIATVGQANKHGVSADEQNKRRGWIESGIGSLQELTAGIENAAAALGIDNLDADSGSQF